MAKACLIFSVLPAMIRNYDFQCYFISAFALRMRLNPYTVDFRPINSPLGLHLSPDYQTDFTPTMLLFFEPLSRNVNQSRFLDLDRL